MAGLQITNLELMRRILGLALWFYSLDSYSIGIDIPIAAGAFTDIDVIHVNFLQPSPIYVHIRAFISGAMARLSRYLGKHDIVALYTERGWRY